MKRLVTLGLFLLCRPAFGALAIDVAVSTGMNSGHTNLTSPVFTTAANDVLLLETGIGSSGINVTSITTAGLSWQKVAFSSQTAAGCSAEVWRSSSAAALTNVTAIVTYNGSPLGGEAFAVQAFSGADLTGTNGAGAIGAFTQQNNVSGNSHAPTCTLTTTRDQSFVVAGMSNFDATVIYVASAGDTLTILHRAGSGDTELGERTTTNVSGLTSTTLSYTNAANTNGTAFICVEVKAAAGAAPAGGGYGKMMRMENLE